MIGIYKITSPSGKIYIGQSVNIIKRKKDYINKHNCKTQPKLYNSLVKYSFSEHIFEVIEECNIEELNTRERYWQDYYKVLEEGLNCRLTGVGDRSGKMSKQSVQRMSQSSGKPVMQYSIKGIFVKEWNSCKEAGSILGIVYENISACCRERIKSAGGFVWRYRGEVVSNEIQIGKVGHSSTSEKLKKKIIQYNTQGEYIQEWESLTKVTESLGIRQGDISACLTGRQKVAKGFIWKYKTT